VERHRLVGHAAKTRATLDVVTPGQRDQQGGISDQLRSAIESTFAATAGSAADSRERAAELLDEVTRRGREAGEEVVRRGQEAGGEVVRRGQEAGGEVVRRGQEAREELVKELRSISERLAKLESSVRRDKP
jgi:polyhydroxyalkanoate synthesis regulator phasin